MENVGEIQEIITHRLKETGDRALPLPEHLKEATIALEGCVRRIVEASIRMNMKGCKRFLHRREIKADAAECALKVANALQLFQVRAFNAELLIVFTLLSICADEAADRERCTDRQRPYHHSPGCNDIRRCPGCCQGQDRRHP